MRMLASYCQTRRDPV